MSPDFVTFGMSVNMLLCQYVVMSICNVSSIYQYMSIFIRQHFLAILFRDYPLPKQSFIMTWTWENLGPWGHWPRGNFLGVRKFSACLTALKCRNLPHTSHLAAEIIQAQEHRNQAFLLLSSQTCFYCYYDNKVPI